MPVQANVSITFQVDTIEEAQGVISGLSGIPEGAVLLSSVSQGIASGVVESDGSLRQAEDPA